MMFGAKLVTFIFLVAFLVSLVFLLRSLAYFVDLLDHPGGRKTHSRPTPLIGGLAIYLTLVVAAIVEGGSDSYFVSIIFWSGMVVCVGLVDDYRGVSWQIRVLVQFFATFGVLSATGVEISNIGTYPLIGIVNLEYFTLGFTILVVIGLSNAFNLIDGINGLCAGLLLIPIKAILILKYLAFGVVDFMLLLLAVSIVVFMCFNFSNSTKFRVFLGDAGSTSLGFIVTLLVIQNVGQMEQPIDFVSILWFFLIPITDTMHVIFNRFLKQQSIFQPGQDHIHHRLIGLGYSSNQTFFQLVFVAFLGVILGQGLKLAGDFWSASSFLILVAFLPYLLVWIGKTVVLEATR